MVRLSQIAFHYENDYEAAKAMCREAAEMGRAHDRRTFAQAAYSLAALVGYEGEHEWAVKYLEGLSPLVAVVSADYPLILPAYHNSLGIELAKVGRVAEAKAALAVTLKSPFARFYPTFQETYKELGYLFRPPQVRSSVFIAAPRDLNKVASLEEWRRLHPHVEPAPGFTPKQHRLLRIYRKIAEENVSDAQAEIIEKVLDTHDLSERERARLFRLLHIQTTATVEQTPGGS
jgi:hypothetical protein